MLAVINSMCFLGHMFSIADSTTFGVMIIAVIRRESGAHSSIHGTYVQNTPFLLDKLYLR